MDGFNPFDFLNHKGLFNYFQVLENLHQIPSMEKYINNLLGPNFWSQVMKNPLHSFNNSKMEVFQTTDEVIVMGEIPGLKKESDIRISIKGLTLFLEAPIPAGTQSESGKTARKISLPAPVSSFGAKALYKNGILEIRLPKEPLPNESHVDIQFL